MINKLKSNVFRIIQLGKFVSMNNVRLNKYSLVMNKNVNASLIIKNVAKSL